MAMSTNSADTLLTIIPEPDVIDRFKNEYNGAFYHSHRSEDQEEVPLSDFAGQTNPTQRSITPPSERRRLVALYISFHQIPKAGTGGYIVGRDPELCDIVISGARGVSNMHLAIQFNWNSRFIVIRNLSRYETVLDINGEAVRLTNSESRNTRSIIPTDRPIIYLGAIGFKLVQRRHDANYCKSFSTFYKACQEQDLREKPDQDVVQNISPLPDTIFQAVRIGLKGRYTLTDSIGSGQFGHVYECVDRQTGNIFAAKQFLRIKSSQQIERTLKEIIVSQGLHHENIVNFHDYITDDQGVLLIMERATSNLEESLSLGSLSMFEVLRVLQQGLKALRYLHEVAKMTHRDVKPANMLITNAVNFHIKLCDFGLATEEPLNTSIQGTRYYWAPEIGNGRYSNSVDIWALGVVILRLITPLPEANDEYDISKWAKIIHDSVPRKPSDKNLGGLVLILIDMLSMDPQQRPTASQCLHHPVLEAFEAETQRQPGSQPTEPNLPGQQRIPNQT